MMEHAMPALVRLFVFGLLAAVLAAAPAQAASQMAEPQARAAAATILKGDPYGKTPDQIAKNIASAQLLTAGVTECGSKVSKPVWQFHVVVPKNRNPSGDSEIDGFLVIDARTGKMVCAGLPFLD
jgi:hypothetical protein